MKRFAAVLIALGPCVAAAQAARSPLAQEVFAAESSFAASMANRDSVAFDTFIANDAIFFGGRGANHGKREVITAWHAFFRAPAPPFSWKPAVVEVLESGALAHSSGPVFDPTGKQVSTFNSVWRKEPDGKWRVVFDKGCSCLQP